MKSYLHMICRIYNQKVYTKVPAKSRGRFSISWYDAVSEAVERITGNKAAIGTCSGMTIAMIAIQQGVPAVICGPGSAAQAHTADEWVDVDQLVQAARVYSVLMSEI